MKDLDASLTGTGSRPADQAAARLAPSGFDPLRSALPENGWFLIAHDHDDDRIGPFASGTQAIAYAEVTDLNSYTLKQPEFQSVSDGSREAGETEGLDPTGRQRDGEAGTPLPLLPLQVDKLIEELKAERLKLDRRIRNQRIQLRMNWQILESRINFGRFMTEGVRSRYLARALYWRDRAEAAEAQVSTLQQKVSELEGVVEAKDVAAKAYYLNWREAETRIAFLKKALERIADYTKEHGGAAKALKEIRSALSPQPEGEGQ